MNSLCDVIVLTWNQLEIIKTFADSFISNTFLPSRLIIIDNNSNDGTKEYLLSLKNTPFCHFQIILNEENKGFVGGMNQGIKISQAEYVCLANNDVIFTKSWLEEIISIFEKNQRIGLINPNSNNLGAIPPKNSSLEEFAQSLRKKYKGTFVEMPFCIGFCMVIKKEVIEKVGGLSKEYFPMFFEDTDYSMKVKKEGYLIGVAKGSYVYHQEHASFKQWPKEKEKVFLRSREVFFKKWGKILRIAFVLEKVKDLDDSLEELIDLARKGNFIWVFIRKQYINREDFFKSRDLVEHSGINFVNYNNLFDLLWKILKKKKKFSLIVMKNSNYIKIFHFFKFIHKAEVVDIKDNKRREEVYLKKKFISI
jgi:GT2 family glycosyltransferase